MEKKKTKKKKREKTPKTRGEDKKGQGVDKQVKMTTEINTLLLAGDRGISPGPENRRGVGVSDDVQKKGEGKTEGRPKR